MSDFQVPAGKDVKVDEGKIEILHSTVDVPSEARQSFLSDPEAYIQKAVEATGVKVNAIIIGNQERSKMIKMVEGAAPGAPVALPMAKAHVYDPPKFASRTIVITMEPK